MSELEEALAGRLWLMCFPACEREYRFDPKRRWRFDFAWPAQLVAVEVEGGSWVNGRHTRGSGFAEDCRKYNEAACLGWRVLRVTDKHINDGSAIYWIRKALGDFSEDTSGRVRILE
jgi:very-short-patch-repair endonuclease